MGHSKVNSTIYVWVFVVFLFFASAVHATTYYIDSADGSDVLSGTDISTPWRTLTQINNTQFSPGDIILFKRGGNWNGLLWPKGSGTTGNPIHIDCYGDPNYGLPHIAGPADGITKPTLYLFNQEYWEIKNLDITHYDPTAKNVARTAVMIQLDEPNLADKQVLNHIYLKNLDIHNVNGQPNNVNACGIYIAVSGDGTAANKAWFNDIKIENCYIHDINTSGIVTWSDFWRRSRTDDANWAPYTNFVIRNNTFYKCSGRAFHTRVMKSPLVEYNVAHGCNYLRGDREEANCFVLFNCDNSIWQYNEVYDHKKFFPEPDGGAFDIDYKSKNCVVQYNYDHDNGMAWTAPCLGGRSRNFNQNPVFRYNISQNDKAEVVHLSGGVDNCQVYNNTIYLGSHLSGVAIIYHKNWKGHPTNTKYYNNIFYNLSSGAKYKLGESVNNSFDYNLFYGNHPKTEPADAHKLTADPRLACPGTGGIGRDSVYGYKLLKTSPCIDSGRTIPDNGGKDYWGNAVPCNSKTDIGAHEWSNDSPSIVNPQADSYVRNGKYAGQNYGNNTGLAVKTSAIGYNREAYLRFDLAGVNGTVKKAILRLKVKRKDYATTHAVKFVSNDIWGQSTLNGHNKPPCRNILATASVPEVGEWIEFDVTDQVRTELLANRKFSVAIVEPIATTYTEYYSSEAGGATIKPQLVVITQMTVFENFASNPTARGWTSSVAGTSSFTYNGTGYLDATLVSSTTNKDRYYLPFEKLYYKQQEFWMEMDFELSSSSTSDYQQSQFGSLYEANSDNDHNFIGDRFAYKQYSGSTRYNRNDLYGYAQDGTELNCTATIDDANGCAYGSHYRAKIHYSYDNGAGVGKATLDIYKISAGGSTGSLVMHCPSTTVIGSGKTLYVDSFGLSNKTSVANAGNNIMKIDNLYFSTTGANGSPANPSF